MLLQSCSALPKLVPPFTCAILSKPASSTSCSFVIGTSTFAWTQNCTMPRFTEFFCPTFVYASRNAMESCSEAFFSASQPSGNMEADPSSKKTAFSGRCLGIAVRKHCKSRPGGTRTAAENAAAPSTANRIATLRTTSHRHGPDFSQTSTSSPSEGPCVRLETALDRVGPWTMDITEPSKLARWACAGQPERVESVNKTTWLLPV
mmetsp:Transcript_2955/g.4850  ORF Transcript_2955/g.4850 Transcript_2955/m.4850 type:complete len:205 (-) Transcript_2955:329-943(-)